MSKNIYDIGIVGAGVAGAFAALRISQKHPKTKTILFDIGAKPGKRRRFLEGFLGCLPNGDGKLYINDVNKVLDIVDGRKANAANKYVMELIDSVSTIKIVKDSLPKVGMQKLIKEANFEIQTNDYIQWKPEQIHQLSKKIAEKIESSGNITFSFDNEVNSIVKKKGNVFVISTESGDITCKKIILAVGRSGWRWATALYKELGLTVHDDIATFGIRVEIASQHMKDFNKSHCTISKPDLEIGPFSWQGTVIPEDHADLVISAFRSNEERWKSDKVSFSLLASKFFKDQGSYQTDRLGKLAFLLFNERVSRERIKILMKNNSLLSMIPEYGWINNVLTEVETLIPNLYSRGYYHVPNIMPMAPKILLGTNLESEIDGLYVAGESAGVRGILAAAIMGTVCGDSASR